MNLTYIMIVDNDIIKSIKITPLLDTLQLEDIPDSDYFSQQYKNYISNSRLGLLKTKGTKAFFEGIKNEYNPSFEFGSLLHMSVLQPDDFFVVDSVFKPSAKAGLMADALYKNDGGSCSDDEIKSMSYKIGYYKDKLTKNRLNEFRQKAEPYWRDRFIYETQNPTCDKERLYTSESNYNLLNNCLESINGNENIQKLLHPTGLVENPYTACENAILMDIEAEIDGETKIYKLKAKLDHFSIDKEENVITINDLKTTSRPAVIFDPTYYSYEREIASYSWLLKLSAKKFFNLDNPKVKGNFLVSSTVPDYQSCVYPMTPQLFKNGWKEYIYLLKCVIYFNIKEGYEFS